MFPTMKRTFRNLNRWHLFVCCLVSGAFSFGFFCGFLSSYCSTEDERFRQQSTKFQSENGILKTTLMVAILSSPANALQRKVIRKTWLRTKNHKPIHHLFVVGTESLASKDREVLEGERTQYKDILFLEHIRDTYDNLSEKLLSSLSWISRNANFHFLLKVDDDSFANLAELYSQLVLRNQTRRLYLGYFDGRAQVQRRGKWAEHDWILCDRYIPYARGGGYVLTSDLVQYIADNRNHFKVYRNEDVSVGVWLAPLDLTRIHDINFDTEYQSRGCSNSFLVTHKQSPQQMIDKYDHLVTYSSLCKVEFQNRKSYFYNWNVLPSSCCFRSKSGVT